MRRVFRSSTAASALLRGSLLAVLAVAAPSACDGGDEPAPLDVGGAAGDAGASGSAADVDAGIAGAPDSGLVGVGGSFSTLDVELQDAACRDYITAWCDRHLECGIFDQEQRDDCMTAVDSCPDRFFSRGSGYTLESLGACSVSWHTFECEELRQGLPDCIELGTLPAGESCGYTTQCASGLCSVLDGECGVCLDIVEPGSPCGGSRQCPSSYLCAFGRCQQLQWYNAEDSLADGSPCNYDGRCRGVCAPSESGDRCVPVPALGEPCAPEGPVLGAHRCGLNAYCDADQICRARPAADQTCATGSLPCSGGLYCDSDDGLAPGTCRAWIELGEPCDPARDNAKFACREFAQCACVDEACSAGICAYASGATTSCAAGEACPAHTECVQGKCTMTFAPACAAE
jgi:hypothetical protein